MAIVYGKKDETAKEARKLKAESSKLRGER
jgi:hypothetical protein